MMTPEFQPVQKSYPRTFLVTITLLALLPRLLLVILTRELPIGLDDMFQYDMLAQSIHAGQGYRWYAQDDLRFIQRYIQMEVPEEYDPLGVRTSFRAPGYPGFLAGVYALNGVNENRFFAARVAQAIVGAALAPLTWYLAVLAGFRDRSARSASGIIAFFPLLIAYTLGLASENTFILLITLSLVFLIRAYRWGGRVDFILAGIILGLTALTRSIVTGFVVVSLAWLLIGARINRRRLVNIGLLIGMFLLITIPWMIRNSTLHDRFTWIETSLGYNMYMGYHPDSTGTFQFGVSLDLLPILDDVVRDEIGVASAIEFIQADPGRVPYLMARKAGYLWGMDKRVLVYFYSNGYLGVWPQWMLTSVLLIAVLPFSVIALAAALGSVMGRFTAGKVIMLLMIGYYTIIHMLIMAEPRFHMPLLPIISTLAAYACIEKPWRHSQKWQITLGAILVSLLLINWTVELVESWDVLMALVGPEGHNLGLSY